jgi:hypothetical protein
MVHTPVRERMSRMPSPAKEPLVAEAEALYADWLRGECSLFSPEEVAATPSVRFHVKFRRGTPVLAMGITMAEGCETFVAYDQGHARDAAHLALRRLRQLTPTLRVVADAVGMRGRDFQAPRWMTDCAMLGVVASYESDWAAALLQECVAPLMDRAIAATEQDIAPHLAWGEGTTAFNRDGTRAHFTLPLLRQRDGAPMVELSLEAHLQHDSTQLFGAKFALIARTLPVHVPVVGAWLWRRLLAHTTSMVIPIQDTIKATSRNPLRVLLRFPVLVASIARRFP